MIYWKRFCNTERLLIMPKNSEQSVKQKIGKDMDKIHKKKIYMENKHNHHLNIKQMHRNP